MKDVAESIATRQAERDRDNERLKQIAQILQIDLSTFRQPNVRNVGDGSRTHGGLDQMAFDAFVSSPDGQSLISNFLNIEDKAMQERILSLLSTLARRSG